MRQNEWPLGAGIHFMQMAQALKPGNSVGVPLDLLIEAEKGEHRSLLFWRTPTREELRAFATKLETTWGIVLTEQYHREDGAWIMAKPSETPRMTWRDNGDGTCTAVPEDQG